MRLIDGQMKRWKVDKVGFICQHVPIQINRLAWLAPWIQPFHVALLSFYFRTLQWILSVTLASFCTVISSKFVLSSLNSAARLESTTAIIIMFHPDTKKCWKSQFIDSPTEGVMTSQTSAKSRKGLGFHLALKRSRLKLYQDMARTKDFLTENIAHFLQKNKSSNCSFQWHFFRSRLFLINNGDSKIRILLLVAFSSLYCTSLAAYQWDFEPKHNNFESTCR